MSILINLLLFVFVLGVIVLIHEFGHFLFAKLTGVYVYEFSLGMGPKLFGFKPKKSETEYSVRMIPIGGFCSLAGEEVDDEDDKKVPDDRKLQAKKPWQRFLIMFMGPGFNFISAFVLLFIIALVWGATTSTPKISSVEKNFPAANIGISKGDIITSIDGHKIKTMDDVTLYLTIAPHDKKTTIKVLKETVDVLSMTATPIPRTLHMSMIGIRGMSTLSEPPMERLPVHTYVLEYNEDVIKEAIEKELSRDGQVIYLNNRVGKLDEIVARIRNLVPEARIGVAHGQMPPEMVEDVMLEFMTHEIDVIVCTTILESGIDVANANTLIVEDSDTLGLAQLYQIRGRVGRSNRLAYAYLTYESNKSLTEVSQKRLKAIKDFTEFGSGFKIALRDLEIRGAGNLLGKEQHGHMAKVGYELYLALLEKAIREEKEGKDTTVKEDLSKEVKIDINVSAYISDMYIKDPIQKIDMYQKISDIKTEEESMEVVDELLDRFGDIPKETENLIKIVEIRNKARKLGINRILATDKLIKFEPMNLKIALTNDFNNDILIRVQLEIKKLENTIKEKG